MTIPTIGAGFLSVRLEEQTKLLDDGAYPTPIGLVGANGSLVRCWHFRVEINKYSLESSLRPSGGANRNNSQGGRNRPKKCLTPLENENSRNMLKICLIHIQT